MHDHHAICFFVNGVEHSTDQHELLAEEILRIGGFKAEEYKLVTAEKPDSELVPGTLVHIHEGERFLALKKKNEFSDIGGMPEIERFVTENLGLAVDHVHGNNGENLVIKNVVVPGGPLAGKTCDVAILVTNSVPFNPMPYFHTRPALVDYGPVNGTQPGQISAEWQYWSRKWITPPHLPEDVWAWVLTALTQAA
jgi:hypothetical protein